MASYYFWLGIEAEEFDLFAQMAAWLKTEVKPPHNIRLPIKEKIPSDR